MTFMRQLQTPTPVPKGASVIAPIHAGGTGANNAADAVRNLGGIQRSRLGVNGGIVRLDGNGKIPINLLPAVEGQRFAVYGPDTLAYGETDEYYITNYDDRVTPNISISAGTLFRFTSHNPEQPNSYFRITAPSVGDEIRVTINTRTFSIKLVQQGLSKPYILALTSEEHKRKFYTNVAEGHPVINHDWVPIPNDPAIENHPLPTNHLPNIFAMQFVGSKLTPGILHIVVNGHPIDMPNAEFNCMIPVRTTDAVYAKVHNPAHLRYRAISSTQRHTSTEWQMASDRGFNYIVSSGTVSTPPLTEFTVIAPVGIHYVRFRYHTSTSPSPWSDTYPITRFADKPITEDSKVYPVSIIDMHPYPNRSLTSLVSISYDGTYIAVANPEPPNGEAPFVRVSRRISSIWKSIYEVKETDISQGQKLNPDEKSFATAISMTQSGNLLAIVDRSLRNVDDAKNHDNPTGLVNGCIHILRSTGDNYILDKTFYPENNILRIEHPPIFNKNGDEFIMMASNKVYLYKYNGVNWSKLYELTTDQTVSPTCLSGTNDLDRFALGYHEKQLVYIYNRHSDNTIHQFQIFEEPHDPKRDGECFGYSMAFSGTGHRLFVSSPILGSTVLGSGPLTAVHMYQMGSQWYEYRINIPGKQGDVFGTTISCNDKGTRLIVGAPNSTLATGAGNLINYGIAYWYKLDHPNPIYPHGTDHSEGVLTYTHQPNMEFSYEVTMSYSGNIIAISSRKQGGLSIFAVRD